VGERERKLWVRKDTGEGLTTEDTEKHRGGRERLENGWVRKKGIER